VIVNSTRQAHGVLNGHVRKAIALQARSPIELLQGSVFQGSAVAGPRTA
jgi:hypothetical protein